MAVVTLSHFLRVVILKAKSRPLDPPSVAVGDVMCL